MLVFSSGISGGGKKYACSLKVWVFFVEALWSLLVEVGSCQEEVCMQSEALRALSALAYG